MVPRADSGRSFEPYIPHHPPERTRSYELHEVLFSLNIGFAMTFSLLAFITEHPGPTYSMFIFWPAGGPVASQRAQSRPVIAPGYRCEHRRAGGRALTSVRGAPFAPPGWTPERVPRFATHTHMSRRITPVPRETPTRWNVMRVAAICCFACTHGPNARAGRSASTRPAGRNRPAFSKMDARGKRRTTRL